MEEAAYFACSHPSFEPSAARQRESMKSSQKCKTIQTELGRVPLGPAENNRQGARPACPRPPPELARLDAWIGRQIEPRPTRPEAIRKLVETALGEPMPQMTKPDMVLKRQTSRKEAANANILQGMEQSSEATLGKMDEALAERALTKIKGERTRRKVVKRKRPAPLEKCATSRASL